MACDYPAQRPADVGCVRRMSTRPTSGRSGGPNLFAAAGLERNAPRPQADKLRPQKLSEVVGQDHLLGPDGVLTRMLEARSLGSLVFWGRPAPARRPLRGCSRRR